MDNSKDLKLKPIIGSELLHRFTFDAFVVGPSNRSAYNAALAVARSTAKKHNPYIIYGGQGLGSTHLMQAIGNYMIKDRKLSNVFFVTTEKFTCDMVDAIKGDKYGELLTKYMSANVLLIDDLQFLREKTNTQAELLRVIQDLADAGRQIVITCDSHMDLSSWKKVLTREIKMPSMKEKIAIATRKAEELKLFVPKEVIRTVAKEASQIRHLESMLIKMKAVTSIRGFATTR